MKSADLQESLISTLLAGGSLSDIVGKAYEHLGTPVLVFDRHMDVQACHPDGACPETLLHARLAITELCVTAALHQTEERAAARALSDKLATLTWDLLEGPDHLRKLALERAKELNAEIPAEYCVLVCHVVGLDKPNSSGVLTGGEIEGRRRSVAEAPGQLPCAHRAVKLSGLRGNELAVVVGVRSDTQVRGIA